VSGYGQLFAQDDRNLMTPEKSEPLEFFSFDEQAFSINLNFTSWYEGKVSGGIKYSEGIEILKSGNFRRGTWMEGELNGKECKEISGICKLFSGNFKMGSRYGVGELRYGNGVLVKGYWKDNKIHGEGQVFFPSGRYESLRWKLGHPNK
jgi:hypothetical protein